ncbi:glutathione S-transferase [Hygrophoropsis aurantiaca]|uniref:Glutathione S-transferase n=1 Tax=Hygrophoropsis aurantiaca TaxID=72124 RepID=A0ACB8AL86_9AGAM|nr:glutathione S-transferase [Hygrophoropsis aurantiaca]
MVVKLYGLTTSTKTRSVAQVCKELNLPYELVVVDIRNGEQKLPKHTQHHPFGQVPYIDDDGFILYESRAIARYLVKKYGKQSGLVPMDDPEAEAKFECAASIEAFNFDPYAYGVAWEKVFKLRRGLQTDEARMADMLASLNAKLDAYEVILGKQAYLAGDNVTLADFFHLPLGTMLEGPGFELDIFTKRPNVSRWWKAISTRPSWLAVKDGA